MAATAKKKMPKLWSGQRFKNGSAALQRQGMSKQRADAIEASRGMKKYGKKTFLAKARAARKRKAASKAGAK